MQTDTPVIEKEKFYVMKEYSYPVLFRKETVKDNMSYILKETALMFPDRVISFTGIGTSGAMLLMAISLNEDFRKEKNRTLLLRKPGETVHRCKHEVENNGKEHEVIVILDDLICSGSTMKSIKDELEDLHLKVEAIFANSASIDRVSGIFPNLKYTRS